MTKLFDKIIGTTTSFDGNSVSDSTASWTVDFYKDWQVVIDGTEYQITANTATSLSFSNSIAGNTTYSIDFIGRNSLTEIEGDASNQTKITDALILKKYNQANNDITNKVFSYLKNLYKTDFDPLANILNLAQMQQSFSYYVLAKIYQDLSIDQESFEAFKGYNMYEKSYIDTVKDSLALLQIDLDKNGVADADELNSYVSNSVFLTR